MQSMPPVALSSVAPAPSRPPLSGWKEEDARDALARYATIVHFEARRLRSAAMRTNALDEEDLVLEGRVAVLEALRRFDGWGTSEASWVRCRVRQRLIDTIRRASVLSRREGALVSQASKGQPLEGANVEAARVAAHRRVISMTTEVGNEPIGDTLSDSQLKSADDLLDHHHRAVRLARAIKGLKPRPRHVIERIFIDGVSARDVAIELGVTESRISQIVHAAVPDLRAIVAPSMFPSALPSANAGEATPPRATRH